MIEMFDQTMGFGPTYFLFFLCKQYFNLKSDFLAFNLKKKQLLQLIYECSFFFFLDIFSNIDMLNIKTHPV